MNIIVQGCGSSLGTQCIQGLLARNLSAIAIGKICNAEDVQNFVKKNDLNIKFRSINVNLLDRCETERALDGLLASCVLYCPWQESFDSDYINVADSLTAFLNILEICRAKKIKHFVFLMIDREAAISQNNCFMDDNHPASLDSAKNRAFELMAHSYSHLYKLPTTGVRLFHKCKSYSNTILINRHDVNAITDSATSEIIDILNRPAVPDAGFNSLDPNKYSSFAPYSIIDIEALL